MKVVIVSFWKFLRRWLTVKRGKKKLDCSLCRQDANMNAQTVPIQWDTVVFHWNESVLHTVGWQTNRQ